MYKGITRDELLGSIQYNPKSQSKFTFQNGPYTEAFENGGWIFFDEIFLAPPEILQIIEALLDSGILVINKNGTTCYIRMHNDFFWL